MINNGYENINTKNYLQWLYKKYGKYFTENYPAIYTKKYWTVDAEDLIIDWIGNKMCVPAIEEILLGAFTKDTSNT